MAVRATTDPSDSPVSTFVDRHGNAYACHDADRHFLFRATPQGITIYCRALPAEYRKVVVPLAQITERRLQMAQRGLPSMEQVEATGDVELQMIAGRYLEITEIFRAMWNKRFGHAVVKDVATEKVTDTS